MKIILLCCLMLIIAMLDANAQDASISGTVVEAKSGENIISITIALYKDSITADSKPIRGTYTNKFGYYSLTKLPAGEYYIAAKGIGYSTFSKRIRLSASEQLRLNIELTTEDVKMGEVVVEAERAETGTSRISSISLSPIFISKMPSLGGEIDVFRAMQLLPGVKQSNELSSGLYVRGGSPDQNLTLLDGVIVYNPIHLGGFLSVFNADALRDVKLIKGAFPAEYGGRISSVLDMTMKEGTKEKISGSGGISLISSRLAIEGPIGENTSFMLAGRRMYLDILAALATGDSDEMPTYYFYDLNLKVNHKISDNDHVFLSGFLCKDILSAPEELDENFSIFWGNQTANLRWMHIASPEVFTNFSLIYTSYAFGTDIYDKENMSNNFKTKSYIRDVMLRAEAQYFPSVSHKIKFGTEAIMHDFIAKAAISFDDDYWESPFNSKDVSSVEASIYAQDEWDITELWNANIGGRLFYFQEANYLKFEPRFSTSYKLSDKTSLKGSVALAHQFLHLIVRNDITLPTDLWFPSTSEVRPSRSWQGVVGAEHLFNSGEYLLSAEFYYKDMRNLYEYKDSSMFSFGIPLENQFTRGRGEAYGMEIFFNKRLGDFTGWIGYTLSWTKRYFDELNHGKMFYPRYDRRHDVNIVLTYKLGEEWELGATWYYGTGQAYTMPTGTYSFENIGDYEWEEDKYQYTQRNGARLPAFHKLDLNFMRYVTLYGLPFTFSINIYNAYNHKNPFAWYISNDWDNNKKQLKQITLFPVIPTIGVSFKF